MPVYRPVTIEGVTYNTIREGWRARSPEGLKEITVRVRLKDGWTPEEAFLTPRVPSQLRRGFKALRTVVE